MERFPRKISRIKPLNRSRRRESALILCLENKQMRRLTSAATRFMERRNLQNLDAHRGHEPDRHHSPCPLPARRGEGGRRPREGWFMESGCSACVLIRLPNERSKLFVTRFGV